MKKKSSRHSEHSKSSKKSAASISSKFRLVRLLYPISPASLVIVVVTLVALGLQIARVSAAAAPSCKQISSGDGTTVATGDTLGIADSGSGTFNFNVMLKEYRTCNTQDKNQQIPGFGWNTNLGTVSFRCVGGFNEINGNKITCGTKTDYGSSLYVVPQGVDINDDGRSDEGLTVAIGYAWGDNMGWISLACLDLDGNAGNGKENFLDGNPKNTKTGNRISCNAQDVPLINGPMYGVLVDEDGQAVEDANFGSAYAWSNTVGYVRFTGTKYAPYAISMKALSSSGSVGGGFVPAPGNGSGTGGIGGGTDPAYFTLPNRTVVYADGRDSWMLPITLKVGGTPLAPDDANLTELSITASAPSGGQVKFDQFLPNQRSDNKGAEHIVDCGKKADCAALYNAGLGAYVLKVTSVAPTDATDLDNNGVTVTRVTVTAKTADGLSLSKVLDMPSGMKLGFSPAVDIPDQFSPTPSPPAPAGGMTSLNPATGNYENKLYGVRNTPTPVKVTFVKHVSSDQYTGANPYHLPYAPTTTNPDQLNDSQIQIIGKFGISESGDAADISDTSDYSSNSSQPYKLFFYKDKELKKTGTTSTTLSQDSSRENKVPAIPFSDFSPAIKNNVPTDETFYVYPFLDVSTGTAPRFDAAAAFLEFRISYDVINTDGTLKPVKYRRLQTYRLKSAPVINQFARISGEAGVGGGSYQETVNLGTSPSAVGGTAGKIGSRKSNFFEEFRKKLSQTVRGREKSTDNSLYKKLSGDTIMVNDTLVTYLGASKTNVGLPNVIYISPETTGYTGTTPLKVVFNLDPTKDTASGVMFVVEGGNVFIDQNVMKTIGLVVLRSPLFPKYRSSVVAGSGVPGQANVNICGTVTEVHAQIRAEGTILSYGGETGSGLNCTDKGFDSNGYPNIDPATVGGVLGSERSVLRNQLSIYGSVISLNTLGGASSTRPVLGDGTLLAAGSQEDLARARREDLNFLRWASVVQKDWSQTANPNRPDKFWWTDGQDGTQRVIVSPSLGSNRGLDKNVDIPPNYPPKYGIVNLFGGTAQTKIPLL